MFLSREQMLIFKEEKKLEVKEDKLSTSQQAHLV